MASTYIGKAPLTLVPTVDGAAHYVYRGRPAPEGIVPADRERLVDEGFLEEVGGSYEDAVVDFVHTDPLVEAGLLRPRPSVVEQLPAVEAQAEAITATPLIGDVDPATGEPLGSADNGQPPAKAAPKEAWVDYAVAQGADRVEAEASTKAELVERFGA